MISYGLSRRFPTWFSIVFIVLAVIGLVALTLWQTASYGYQIVTVVSPDNIVHEKMWYLKFIPNGYNQVKYCDPAQILVGSSIKTTNGVYNWEITDVEYLGPSANISSPPMPGWEYAAEVLNCTMTDVTFRSSLADNSVEIAADVLCINSAGLYEDEPLAWYMTTTSTTNWVDYHQAEDAITQSPRRIGQGLNSYGDEVRYAVDFLAFDHLGVAFKEARDTPPNSFPVTIQALVNVPPCLGHCFHSLPQLDVVSAQDPNGYGLETEWNTYADGSFTYNDTYLLRAAELQSVPFKNLVNGFVSAVQFDLGNFASDSIFAYQNSTEDGLAPTVTVDPNTNETDIIHAEGGPLQLRGAQFIRTPNVFDGIPFDDDYYFSNITLQPLYSCQTHQARSVWAALPIIFAAIVGAFHGLWGFFVLVGAFFFGRHDKTSNYCEGHLSMLEQGVSPSTSMQSTKLPVLSYDGHSHQPSPQPYHQVSTGTPLPPMSPSSQPHGLQSPSQRWSEPGYFRPVRPSVHRDNTNDSRPSFTPKA